MNTWGFKYQTNMVWDKQPANSKHYLQWQHEILLIGTKGNFTPSTDVHISPIYSEELNSQNAKPKWFNEQIERMFPNEKYLELFASNKYNENWVLLKNLTEIEEANSK
jgi:N6-adenosine-specific RNA methylase IME4